MEIFMSAVTVSPKYQVVIPKEARKILGFKPGQKLEVLVTPGHLSFILVPDLADMEGIFKGMDTSIPKEKEKY
jgi:AbrB family looped-hinge helix DNA binding protein